MPGFNENEDIAEAVGQNEPDITQQTQPNVTPTPVRTAIVDSDIENLTNIIVNISGTPWRVQYYSQVLGADDQPGAQQLDQLPVYQQYIYIKDLEIRVQDALTETIDPETTFASVSGSALSYPNLIPNIGDAFIADIGSGRIGVFYVTEVTKLSTFNETCYRFEYTAVAYGVDVSPYQVDLDEKTTKTLIFTKELLEAGRNELLVEEDHYNRETLIQKLKTMLRIYFAEFYDPQYSTLMYPADDAALIYDKYIVRFIQATIDQHYNSLIPMLVLLNTGGTFHMNRMNLLDVIREMSKDLLPVCSQRMWRISPGLFNKIPALHSLRFMKIHGLVYPSGFAPGIEGPSPAGGSDLWTVVPPESEEYQPYPNMVDFDEVISGSAVPTIHPVNKDDFYIFSEEFYANGEGQSALELLVRRAFDNETISHKWLINLCDASTTWRKLERFYYVPILATLVRGSLLRF